MPRTSLLTMGTLGGVCGWSGGGDGDEERIGGERIGLGGAKCGGVVFFGARSCQRVARRVARP